MSGEFTHYSLDRFSDRNLPEEVIACDCCGDRSARLTEYYDRGERKEVYLCAPCAVGQGFIEEPEENTDE